MAQFLHRADAAGLTISAMLPPAHPLSDPRPYRSVAASGQGDLAAFYGIHSQRLAGQLGFDLTKPRMNTNERE